jgi:hypothetical protein
MAFNGKLYAADKLKTGSPGMLMFHSNYLAQCREYANSSDVLAPTSAIAIKHLTGITWCRHALTGNKTILSTPGAKISVTGTIVGMETTPQGTVIKLDEGSALVTVKGQRPIPIGQGKQLLVSPTGPVGRPSPIILSPEDQLTLGELQFHVLQIGPGQSDPFLQSFGSPAAVVVGSTFAEAQSESKQVTSAKTSAFTAAQAFSNPSEIAAELERLGGHAVITTGSATTMPKLWQTLRSKLLPEISLVYVSS